MKLVLTCLTCNFYYLMPIIIIVFHKCHIKHFDWVKHLKDFFFIVKATWVYRKKIIDKHYDFILTHDSHTRKYMDFLWMTLEHAKTLNTLLIMDINWAKYVCAGEGWPRAYAGCVIAHGHVVLGAQFLFTHISMDSDRSEIVCCFD